MTGREITVVDQTKTRKVTLMKSSRLEYPELWLEVYIASHRATFEDRNFAQMFSKARCSRATSPEKADLVVFVGGVDVDPALYGIPDKADWHPTQDEPDQAREDADYAVYTKCIEEGIPMLGVCRGAQLLHAYNGGSLYQHIDGHTGRHMAWDLTDKAHRRAFNVSSVHHQACMPNPEGGMIVLADAYGSHIRCRNNRVSETGAKETVEAFYYRDTLCLGVQFHPEYPGYEESAVWTMNQISKLLIESPDTMVIDRYRRLKPEIMAERDAEWERLRIEQEEDGPAEDPDDLDDPVWSPDEDLVRAGYDLDPDMDDEDYEEIVNHVETVRQQMEA